MATFGDGKIEAYVGPVELGAADNLEQVIVDFIGGAKKTLDIAIQRALASRTADMCRRRPAPSPACASSTTS